MQRAGGPPRGRWRRIGTSGSIAVLLAAAAAVSGPAGRGSAGGGHAVAAEMDEAASRAAFLAAYRVFMHPRCMNCHPAGDAPLQGDESRPHAQNVKRGAGGRGRYALKCANCHQHANLPGDNMPPGNPVWHLPPAHMPMVFQGKTPAELARHLKDPQQNGGKTLEQVLQHMEKDSLVLWGWDPGDGRTPPPLPHAEFVRAMRDWVEQGAAIPE